MYKTIKEGKALIKVPIVKKISKEMDVFYNPVMKFNRDISVLLLNSIDKTKLNIADPLAGSGIRSIRFLLELKKNKIKTISVNDYSNKAIKSIKNNLSLNKIKTNKNITIKNQDANLFLLNSTGFDYIDIDPFGTPNPYLDSAIRRISREGILAVTATDTSALAGTYPKACLRKYWALPLRNELMHEIGLRILIRKIQLIAAQYNKALTPIFSYFKDHYMRIFLKCEKSKQETDNILKQHRHFENSGPIWKGQLYDKKLVNKMIKNNKIKENEKILNIIQEESKINTIGFYDLHKIAKKHKLKIPKKEELIKKLRKKGYKASSTHFSGVGVKSNIRLGRLLRLLRS
jgi:tRNA (guanine26-N2/guanine27-N2)-dimethyltransferase